MTKKEKWIVDEDDELRLFYGDENFNGSAYPCNDIVFMKMIADKLNKLEKENEQLKKELSDDFNSSNCITVQKSIISDLKKENEKLKQTIDDLRTYSNDEFTETEYINNIYKEKGFCGVIKYAKDKLQQYGVVKEVEKGLWVMVTGGWSDNEFWLNCLNNPVSIFYMKHYRGYLRGGAFYYTEKPREDVKIILKGDVE